jgi:hypothetical protein
MSVSVQIGTRGIIVSGEVEVRPPITLIRAVLFGSCGEP